MNACTRFLQHRLFPLVQVFAITTVVFLPLSAHAWGEPHLAITKAATEVLPDWQKELLGPEMEMLAGKYCLIPDEVYTDKENARYAAMPETRPGEVYLLNLHLPDASQAVNLDALRYFMGRAVAALKAGQTTDAAKYLGTICHQLEDYGSPSHTVPGDNMFTLLTQFLPPPDDMKGLPMHGPIENGTLDVKIPGYKPQLLGLSVEEASWRLLHRIHEGILNARQTTLPILQALYAKDPETVKTWQMKRRWWMRRSRRMRSTPCSAWPRSVASRGADGIARCGHRGLLSHRGREPLLPPIAVRRLTELGLCPQRVPHGERHPSRSPEAGCPCCHTRQRTRRDPRTHPRHQRGDGQDPDLPSAQECLWPLHRAGRVAP